jgi:dihydroorotate dehydrogenase electron transfer subunit
VTPQEVRVVERLQPAPDCFELVLEFPQDESPQPGQFYMLSAGEALDTYLPRPFSFYRVFSPRRLSFLFRVVGPGTAALSRLRARDRLQATGPLGHGFPLPQAPERAVLVAGGVGVPPLWSLGRAILGRGGTVTAILGARTASGLLGRSELAALGAAVLVATDDGSTGHHGPVTDLLPELRADAVYACGPAGMLQAVQASARSAGPARTYLALEAAMACGYGLCLGCAVERAGPDPELAPYGTYARVCREGPVFRWDEVKL